MLGEHSSNRASLLRIGLIGDPVAHSYSPYFQQAALDALGIPARYELWQTEADELPARIASLRDPECLGANVTIPYKEAVLIYLDAVDPLTVSIGAVNTIVNRDGYLYGYNTDAPGLLYTLAEQGVGEYDDEGRFSLRGYSVVLLGAGGAARGAAFALGSASVTRLVIVNRHVERAQRLAADVAGAFAVPEMYSLNEPNSLKPHPKSLIINATPVGMHDDVYPLPLEVLARFAQDTFVFDMIYNPVETRLLREARTLGVRAANGLPMLLHQGALAFTLWTGQPAPIEVMRSALWALQESERGSSL